jgi:hypothetical protein
VSKSYIKLDSVGYITGKRGTSTYGVTGLQFKDGMMLKDLLD